MNIAIPTIAAVSTALILAPSAHADYSRHLNCLKRGGPMGAGSLDVPPWPLTFYSVSGRGRWTGVCVSRVIPPTPICPTTLSPKSSTQQPTSGERARSSRTATKHCGAESLISTASASASHWRTSIADTRLPTASRIPSADQSPVPASSRGSIAGSKSESTSPGRVRSATSTSRTRSRNQTEIGSCPTG